MREGKVADVRTSLRRGGGKGCVNRPPFWVEKKGRADGPVLEKSGESRRCLFPEGGKAAEIEKSRNYL
jgi:hypothetical protein